MFNGVFKDKKVLVTGNTGFKGSWLTSWLLMLEADVYGISDEVPTDPAMFDVLNLKDKITYYQEDICNTDAVQKIIDTVEPDVIFHLAAQPIVKISYDDPLDTFKTNVMGTASVLDALRKAEQKCVAVMITSDKCYDNVEWCWGYREVDALGGKDPYSASKAAAEMVIKTYYNSFFKNNELVKIVSVRAGNVIGGGDWAANRIVPDCFKAWNNGDAVTIRSPKSTRPWQHVLEPLSGYLRVAQVLLEDSAVSGESYNFGPKANQTHSVYDLLMALSEYWSFDDREKVIVNSDSLFHEAGLLKLNCDKASAQLQWLPTLEFEKTVEFTALWYNKFYNSDSDMYKLTEKQIIEYSEIAATAGREWIK